MEIGFVRSLSLLSHLPWSKALSNALISAKDLCKVNKSLKKG